MVLLFVKVIDCFKQRLRINLHIFPCQSQIAITLLFYQSVRITKAGSKLVPQHQAASPPKPIEGAWEYEQVQRQWQKVTSY